MKEKLFTRRQDIIAWLDKQDIKNYTLLENAQYGWIVNAQGVSISNRQLKSIPVKFNKIGHFFDCSQNDLTSLDFAPEIVNGPFNCGENKLTSLLGCPKEVHGNFFCYKNRLTDLIGCPQVVKENMSCHTNELTSLKGLGVLGKGLFLSYNKLTSLEGCPQEIKGILACDNNCLTSLIGLPKSINLNLSLHNNNLSRESLAALMHCTINEKIEVDNNPLLKELQDIKNVQELMVALEKDILSNTINVIDCDIRKKWIKI